MAYASRQQSEGDVYHVYARGVGRQLIFEDDSDRAFFLNVLGSLLAQYEGTLYAWALMGNHFHLLLKMPIGPLSNLMRDLQMVYVRRFNKKYDRVGHLFQGRFGSQPITSDEQLLACVRYIHRNPVNAHLCKTCDYKWSSYRSYLRGVSMATDTRFVLAVFGGVESFVKFHDSHDDGRFAFDDVEDGDSNPSSRGCTDDRANEIAVSVLGDDWRKSLLDLSKSERNSRLRQLKEAGLSIRQIERLTGLGRGIISRA